MRGYLREAFLQVIRLPFEVLRWLAIGLDKILPQSGIFSELHQGAGRTSIRKTCTAMANRKHHERGIK